MAVRALDKAWLNPKADLKVTQLASFPSNLIFISATSTTHTEVLLASLFYTER